MKICQNKSHNGGDEIQTYLETELLQNQKQRGKYEDQTLKS